MKLLLVASLPLRPYLECLLPEFSHEIDVFYLPDDSGIDFASIQRLILNAHDYDAIVCADGAAVVCDQGLTAGEIPLVFPRVHNCISLLLGSAQAYRGLFSRFDGQLCWALPNAESILTFIPSADCTCLCYLADTLLGLRDSSLSARTAAQENGWDYFHVESDVLLLKRLLRGDWDGDDILVVPKNESVSPNFRYDILA
ncbi:hypothetical protein V6615_10200 [Oscillospiraceae bacterium PP1C4]